METETAAAPTKKTTAESPDELLGLLVSTPPNTDLFRLGPPSSFTPQAIAQLHQTQLEALEETVVVSLQEENHRHLLSVQVLRSLTVDIHQTQEDVMDLEFQYVHNELSRRGRLSSCLCTSTTNIVNAGLHTPGPYTGNLIEGKNKMVPLQGDLVSSSCQSADTDESLT